ncbi:DUF3616 domain-containing protein [Thiomicrorhabdus sp.]|uniref:DUF3616 domain-containing protein n=1 Tax=Thiomicrorhabdus sp. TaxID=2039724 RepID=UPI002AA8A3DD|nr:DUF3616 domain-containing protein [Thiomicrorhabdus sp.]
MRLFIITCSCLMLLFSNTSYSSNNTENPIAKPITKEKLITNSLQIDNLNISGIALPYSFMALATDEGNQIQILQSSDSQHWASHSVITLTNNSDEIDIEALAWQAPYLYALGSHSAKRKKLKTNKTQKENQERLNQTSLEPARQQLFRIKLDKNAQAKEIQSLSLQEIIKNDPILKSFVGIPSKENGIDLEGLAIDQKGRLLVGFRGPVLRGNIATVLRIKLAKKAFKIKSSKQLFIQTIGTGIRGLSETDQSQQFLVLTGAVGDQPLPYQVSVWNGKNALRGSDSDAKNAFKPLCDLPSSFTQNGKAEGIQFIHQTGQSIDFLIVFDGIPNGKPTLFSCNLVH